MNKINSSQQLLDLLSKAYAHDEVKNVKELADMILSYASEVEKTDNYMLVATRLCKSIEIYSLSHNFKYPKALSELYKQLKPFSSVYAAANNTAYLSGLFR